MEPTQERDLIRQKVQVDIKGDDEAVLSMFHTINFEQVRQLVHDLQDALFQMGTRRGK